MMTRVGNAATGGKVDLGKGVLVGVNKGPV